MITVGTELVSRVEESAIILRTTDIAEQYAYVLLLSIKYSFLIALSVESLALRQIKVLIKSG